MITISASKAAPAQGGWKTVPVRPGALRAAITHYERETGRDMPLKTLAHLV